MLGKRFTALLAIAMPFAFAICFLPDSALAQRASASASVDNAGPALPAALPDAAPAPQDVTGTPVQADAIVNGAQADNCQKSVSRASARSVTAQANAGGGGSAGVTRSSSNSVTVQRGGGLFSGLVARIAERRAHRHSTIASAAQARAANSASTTVTRQRTVTRLSGGSLSRAAGGAAGGSAAGGGSGAGNASAHAEAHATGN